MNERLLRIMIKSRKITVAEIQSFFQLNKEETIDLLLQFLEQEILNFDSNAPQKNKYLFYTLDMVKELYDTFKGRGCRLPYRHQFRQLQQELYDLNHFCKKTQTVGSHLSMSEQIYLEIYYYKDFNRIQKILSEDVINSIDDPLLVEGITYAYLQSLRTSEYDYYRQILELFVHNGSSNHDLLFCISHCIQKSLKQIAIDFPLEKIDCLRHADNLLSDIHTTLVEQHRSFAVASEKKPSVKRPFIFTIDEDTTYVREDAISVTKDGDDTYITIYIIDPCNKIFENQTLLNTAMEQWFERDSKQLFDMDYAHRYFSLNQGVARKVIAFEYCFDKSNHIKRLNIFEDKIRVNENFTYEQITEMLNEKRKDKPPIPYLKELYDIVGVLHDNNIYKKKYHLLKQLHYYLNNDGKYKKSEDKNGYMIVSELKILINYSIARLFHEAQIPCIYRNNQFVASKEELEHLEQNCNEIDDATRIYDEIQNLNIESWYSNENEGHYGLHLDYYIHATTPVRNYFSLYNLKILKDIVIHKKFNRMDSYQQEIEQLMIKQQSKVQKRKSGRQKVIQKKEEMEI